MRNRYLPKLGLFSCLLLSFSALAQSYNVGLDILHVKIPDSSLTTQVGIWYPTDATEKQEHIGPLTLNVATSAKPIDQIKGEIVIAHGFSGSLLGHNDSARYLAQHGYVVVTPTYPDLKGIKTNNPDLDPLALRPRLTEWVLHHTVKNWQYASLLKGKPLGMMGYSMGGYAAVFAAGGDASIHSLVKYCAKNPKDTLTCSPQTIHRFELAKKDWPNNKSSKVAALFLMAPAYGNIFTQSSLSKLHIPVRIVSAGHDQELGNGRSAQYLAKNFPPAKSEVLPRAGHFTFLTPCPKAIATQHPSLCQDAEGVDRTAIHQKLNQEMLKFFNESLSSSR